MSTSTVSTIPALPAVDIDIPSLSNSVRHYLKSNQIQWGRFSTLVLGVSQSRLSTLLCKPQSWNLLTRRVKSLYQRMQLWMDTRATYGNNPHYREKTAGKVRVPKGRKKSSKSKRPRSLFETEENIELMRRLEVFSASQAFVKESAVEIQVEGGAGAMVEVFKGVEVGLVQVQEVLEEPEEVVLGREREVVFEEVIDDGVVELDMETGDDQENMILLQLGTGDKQGEEEGVVPILNQEELQLGMQLVVEDIPDEPGFYKLTLLQVSGDLVD